MSQSRKKSVTLRDVAARAGVSTAVVSYAINNNSRPVSAEARARIEQAIEELGYHPNAFARAMSTRQTRTIGFIVQDTFPRNIFISPYTAYLLSSVYEYLKTQGYYLLVYGLEIDEALDQVRELVQSKRLDGVILRLTQDAPQSDALMQTIADSGLPCVCIERPAASRFGYGSVTYGDLEAAYAATSLLIELGHRRIAHLQGDPRAAAARDRRDGYAQALQHAGFPVDERLIAGDSWRMPTGISATEEILAHDARTTAIFAANDYLAIGALTALQKRGLRVPDDMAVIGYDDVPLAADVMPALTTVHVPLQEIGTQAAARLLEGLQAKDETPVHHDLIPAELVRRASA